MQYIKIKNAILGQIEAGSLLAGTKLPSERQLAQSFDTTRITLREALSVLESEGYIYKEDRRGWFISPAPLQYELKKSISFFEMATTQGRTPWTRVVVDEEILATKKVADKLRLPPFTKVLHLGCVRYLDKRPVVYADYFFTNTLVDLYGKAALYDWIKNNENEIKSHEENESTDKTKKNINIIDKVEYCINTNILPTQYAFHLNAGSGELALTVHRVSYIQGKPIEYMAEYWRHEVICISSSISD